MGKGIEFAAKALANEKYISEARVKDGKFVFDIDAFAPKTFAIRHRKEQNVKSDNQISISLPFNFSLVSENNSNSSTDIFTISK